MEFPTDLGLQIAPGVDELAESQTFLGSTRGQSICQVPAGRVATIGGTAAVPAVSPPAMLSLTYGLDDYLTALDAAVAARPRSPGSGRIAGVEATRDAVLVRLRPLLTAVHEALTAGVTVSRQIHREHGWQPAADPHLDRQLVRRHAMEVLRPWSASVGQQLEFDLGDSGTDNLGLPMSGLIITTETDVLRVWHSADGELPPADTRALQAFYGQSPTRQTQLVLEGAPPAGNHLALLWADRGDTISRLELVRPWWRGGRHPEADWRVDLLR